MSEELLDSIVGSREHSYIARVEREMNAMREIWLAVVARSACGAIEKHSTCQSSAHIVQEGKIIPAPFFHSMTICRLL